MHSNIDFILFAHYTVYNAYSVIQGGHGSKVASWDIADDDMPAEHDDLDD